MQTAQTLPRPGLLPRTVGARVRAAAVASVVAEVLLVGTGAAVRLTGSGLGCPTWPRCTADSFATTPVMGVHGLVEFGNRLLTFVLVVVAVAAVLAVVRLRRERRDLFALSLVQLFSIPVQAVLGGITVLTGLNPWLVGAHFLFSLGLIVAMTVFVHRTRTVPGPRVRIVSSRLFAVGRALAGFAAVVLALGVTTTGSGPHAGDANAPRNGLDPVLLAGVHETAAWGLAIVTVVLVLGVRSLPRARARGILLLSVEAAQIAVGVTQVSLGWAAGFVVVHVFLAGCLTAAVTWFLLALREPASAAAPVRGSGERTEHAADGTLPTGASTQIS